MGRPVNADRLLELIQAELLRAFGKDGARASQLLAMRPPRITDDCGALTITWEGRSVREHDTTELFPSLIESASEMIVEELKREWGESGSGEHKPDYSDLKNPPVG